MSKVIVYHASLGCETGCCGHVIEVDGERHEFTFSHPDSRETFREFAESVIATELGAEHVADLDWENCAVGYD